MHVREVMISPMALDRLQPLLLPGRSDELTATAKRGRELLEGKVVWNINSTASGGGVAEMLQTLLAYGRGVGVDTRWLVIEGDPDFFVLTKRLHNMLHGATGDAGPLGTPERAHYVSVLAGQRDDLLGRIRPEDVVLLHDPQTAGLVDLVQEAGAHAVWRCHIGSNAVTPSSEAAWAFLRPFVEKAGALVFTRPEYAPEWVPQDRLHVIAPSIDPLAVKNRDLDDRVVDRLVALAGLSTDGESEVPVTFLGRDGSSRVVRRHNDLIDGEPPPAGAPLVVQVSRWDRLKDMAGVMTAFVDHVATEHQDAHLLLVGPAVAGVSDDPEGADVLAECTDRWRRLPSKVRRRVHLVQVPMDDLDENALIVNALQRRAAIVVQKSIAEGFGLTVTEAMWKARPVVASSVGGIPDQITPDVEGILVDPLDLSACGAALRTLLGDPDLAADMGAAARTRVRSEFLGDRHLRQYVDLFETLLL